MTLISAEQYSQDLKKLSEGIEPGKSLLLTKHGYFLAINHDLLVSVSLMKYGELCELEWQLMSPFIKPEMVVVDAGSHLGTFLVPFARRVGPRGKVIGFEPQPVIFESLKTAVLMNKISNAELHHCCIGNSDGEIEIMEPDYAHIGHFGGVTFTEKTYKEVRNVGTALKSRIERLDDVFKEPRLDFIKIDVEGMEREVLKGARASILKHRPVMFIENDKPANSKDVLQLIFDMDYRIWWHTGRLYNPDNHNKNTENVFGQRSNVNILCLPRERGDSEVPKGLLECTDASKSIIQPDGQINVSIPDYEPRL